jgi:hypothetical protein
MEEVVELCSAKNILLRPSPPASALPSMDKNLPVVFWPPPGVPNVKLPYALISVFGSNIISACVSRIAPASKPK